MKIAVTGGTGFVGRSLLDLALGQGHEINALARRPQEGRRGIEWVQGDLANTDALTDLVTDAEAAVHVAGVVNAPDAAGFEEGNVRGTANLLDAAHRKGLSRFVFVSSLSAREPDLSDYGGSKARAEELVRSSGLDWTIVRPPAIYGPRDTEMLELFKAAKWGIVPTPKEGRASVIHVDDLSRLLLALLPGSDGLTGQTVEPDDAREGGWPHDELARAIGAAVGRRPVVIGLSRPVLETAARIDQFFRGARAKLTLDRARYFSHPDWVVGKRPSQDLWQPQIETREGLKATADWYREQGWL